MDQSYKPAGNVAWRRVAEEVVVLDLDTSVYYSFNHSGARIWELLAESLAPRQVAARVAEEYDEAAALVARDVEALLKQLRAEKLLV